MRIKRGITLPYEYALKKSDGTAVDLTNATSVTMKLIEDGASEYTIDGACTIASPKTAGKVQYAWSASETGTPGFYWLSFIITYTNGTIEEIPSNGFDYILIL
jgi:hypothetical protein